MKILINGLLILIIMALSGIHKIEEGYIGIYYEFGVLSQRVSSPGFHYMVPIKTRYQSVQISLKTHEIANIPCGSSTGVLLKFENIEVVTKLKQNLVLELIKNYTVNYDQLWITDKIHHEINNFCSVNSLQEILIDKFEILDEFLLENLELVMSRWAPAIEIIAIRVTKPIIPKSIAQQFFRLEEEKTKYLIETEKQRTTIQNAKIDNQVKLIKAQTDLEVNKIKIAKNINEIESRLQLMKIENEIFKNKAICDSDSKFDRMEKEVEIQRSLVSEKYLLYKSIEALTSNVTLFIGNKIPKINFG